MSGIGLTAELIKEIGLDGSSLNGLTSLLGGGISSELDQLGLSSHSIQDLDRYEDDDDEELADMDVDAPQAQTSALPDIEEEEEEEQEESEEEKDLVAQLRRLSVQRLFPEFAKGKRLKFTELFGPRNWSEVVLEKIKEEEEEYGIERKGRKRRKISTMKASINRMRYFAAFSYSQ
jgi:hypothetical protein